MAPDDFLHPAPGARLRALDIHLDDVDSVQFGKRSVEGDSRDGHGIRGPGCLGRVDDASIAVDSRRGVEHFFILVGHGCRPQGDDLLIPVFGNAPAHEFAVRRPRLKGNYPAVEANAGSSEQREIADVGADVDKGIAFGKHARQQAGHMRFISLLPGNHRADKIVVLPDVDLEARQVHKQRVVAFRLQLSKFIAVQERVHQEPSGYKVIVHQC